MGRITGERARNGWRRLLERLEHRHKLAPEAQRGGKPTLELPAYTVHPYRLVRALAAHAASLGARICEHVAVEAVEAAPRRRASSASRADARSRRQRGDVHQRLYGLDRRAIPRPAPRSLRNYMVATEPLDAEAVARLGGGQAFMVELNKSYIFYRLHQGRLVYGGIETFFRTPPVGLRCPGLDAHSARAPPRQERPLVHRTSGSPPSGAARSIRRRPTCRSSATRRARKSIVFNIGYGGTGVALTQLFAPLAAAIALDLPLADAEDARLGEIMRATRFPLASLVKFGGGIAWDVVRGASRASPLSLPRP